jgi:hypothetical protein
MTCIRSARIVGRPKFRQENQTAETNRLQRFLSRDKELREAIGQRAGRGAGADDDHVGEHQLLSA